MKNKNDFGEFEFIEKIKKRFASSSSEVLLGMGDDSAHLKSLPAGLLVTVDMLMEGVHFDLAYCEPEDVGAKALAVNLSDIAAMGGTPKFILASLGIRPGLSSEFMDRLFTGFEILTKAHQVTLVGGNLTRSPHSLAIDIVAMGTPGETVFKRSGAKAGDLVAVTGNLGSAAAGFHALKKFGRAAVTTHSEIAMAQIRPEPRIKEGKELARWGRVTSAIDVSDGLAAELGHLAAASQVGFEIEAANLPALPSTKRYAEEAGQPLRQWQLYGGEDYEVLFTFDPKSGKPPVPCTAIGVVTAKANGIKLRSSEILQPLEISGWDHFKS